MMNEEMEQFEQRLRRQPVKEIPTEWRAEILATANATRFAPKASRPTLHSRLSNINLQLSAFFWPHPKAWAALATVWIFIFVLNFSMRDKSPVVTEKYSPPSPEVMAELRQQKLLFAELMGQTRNTEHDADRRENLSPRPRSRRVEFIAV